MAEAWESRRESKREPRRSQNGELSKVSGSQTALASYKFIQFQQNPRKNMKEIKYIGLCDFVSAGFSPLQILLSLIIVRGFQETRLSAHSLCQDL